MNRARNPWLPLFRGLSVLALGSIWAIACGGPQKQGEAGSVCFRADDCKDGLVCVATAADPSKSTCTNDLSSIVSMVDGAPTEAAAPAADAAGGTAGVPATAGAVGTAGAPAGAGGKPATGGATGTAGAGGKPASGGATGAAGAGTAGKPSGGSPSGGAPAGGSGTAGAATAGSGATGASGPVDAGDG
jgi:hypothetical protein